MTQTPVLLAIGYVWPEPNSSAAGKHMLSLLHSFQAWGYKVIFASPAQLGEHRYDLSQDDIAEHAIALNCSSFDTYVQQLNPDVVLFDRFMMEEQFGWRVRQYCPNALCVLDTEDLHSLRQARHQAVKAGRDMCEGDIKSELAMREVAAIYRCDVTLIISDAEYQLLQTTFGVPANLLWHLPFLLDSHTQQQPKVPYDQRAHFIAIGNFRHEPNWDAVLQLKQTIWPLIRKALPQVELHIYGAYPPPKAMQLHNPKQGFVVKGWAKDALEVISQSKVLLAPLRFGAGIKGKLTDAMQTGTPSVTTTIGIEGMASADDWPGLVEDNPNDFAEAAIHLYQNAGLWQQSADKASVLLHSKFNRQQHQQALGKRIEQLRDTLVQHRLANFTGSMLNHHHHQSTKYMAQWIEAKNRHK